jgi:hypothetical protein
MADKKYIQERLGDIMHNPELAQSIAAALTDELGYSVIPDQRLALIAEAGKRAAVEAEGAEARAAYTAAAQVLQGTDEAILRAEIGAYCPFFDFLDFLIEKAEYGKGAYISGEIGSAKSHHVESRLAKSGIEYVVMNTAITPLSLYFCLYENKDGRVIVFDDVVGLFEPKAMAVLRSALFAVSGVRVIKWQSTAKVLEEKSIPQSFVFNSRIIIIQNRAERGMKEELQALLSRLYVYDLRLTLLEKKHLMRIVLGRNDFFGLPMEEKEKLIVFMESISSFGNSVRYNLRTGIQAAEFWAKNGEAKAKPMIAELLETDMEMVKFLTIEEQGAGLPVGARVAVFERLSGRSRRGYFDLKKKYRQALHTRTDLKALEIADVVAELKIERGVKYIGGGN